MKIEIIAVGKISKQYLKEGINDYITRLSKYCDVKITEIEEVNTNNLFNTSQINQALDKEADKIIKKLSESSYNILMEIQSKEITSNELSDKMSDAFNNGYNKLTFIIGSSYGTSKKILDYIDDKISFGRITLPHQLFRLVLLEQIYRAFKIIKNEPYHK